MWLTAYPITRTVVFHDGALRPEKCRTGGGVATVAFAFKAG